jgi:aminopeptidase-like protein
MSALMDRIASLRLAPASPDTDRFSEILCEELPFTVHEYPVGSEHNGWVIPQMWEADVAEIRRDGKLIYDGMANALGVIGYSQSFVGTVTREELLPHLFFHADRPNDLVYHCNLYYRLGEKDWGFSVPRRWRESLDPGEYQVNLETSFSAGTMKVLDYVLPGETDETIIINAHNCHAGQANDDLSGVVAGIETIRQLAKRGSRRFTYRLIIAPEHFGTVFFLAGLDPKIVSRFQYAIFLETVGNDNRLALQRSFTGDTDLDRAGAQVIGGADPGSDVFGFRELIGNDETVWEAPGYEIPTVSLTRFPFAEYHSSRDTPDIIIDERLDGAVGAVIEMADVLEHNSVMHRKFTGLIALSNPQYDLYISPGADPSQRSGEAQYDRAWNHLMDMLPRYFDGETSLLDIAERHDIPFALVRDYVRRFEEKGLIGIEPV